MMLGLPRYFSASAMFAENHVDGFSAIIRKIIASIKRRRLKFNALVSRSRLSYFVRCTRRYTPGLCVEPVASVWTFVFQLQNCTERYGCQQDWRTNRFTTYERCMKRCKPLIDFYTQTLALDPHNLSAYIRSQPWNKSGRRDSGDDEFDGTDIKYDYGPVIQGNLNGPAPNLSEDSIDHRDWAVTVDIDDVDVDDKENDGLMDDDSESQVIVNEMK